MHWLNPLRLIRSTKRAVERRSYGDTFWAHYRNLDLFVPVGRGSQRDMIRLAFQGAGQVFPLLEAIVTESGAARPHEVDADAFCRTDAERKVSQHLKLLFDRHGSDKAAPDHNYHPVYGAILQRIPDLRAMLEVGLGTNNENVFSNMTCTGKPGASLRAFRDYLPSAKVFGADVDRLVLFQEERIRTVFIDQTDLASFHEAEALGPFDLVIDDGLHSPNANLAILLLGIRRLNPGGWIVIEDILPKALPVWRTVGAVLPERYRASIIRTAPENLMFVVERTA